ncbi:oxidoreductase-like protein 22 [Elsinoe australis]|uniref:Oxidoreductase-like protein 22 n=1 Tax=Elsinoe australis TaxID=40998 RepID=A0A4U7ATX5_9PEZI|nr:oxidoreductase-like protein 22 [Elsinoe australis]
MEADIVWGKEELEPYGVTLTTTFEEMIETPGLEAIIIASSTHLHTSQSLAALDRGIHVLCEKPICKTTDQLEGLIARANASTATLMVAFVRRFDENYRDALARIQQNAIGRPVTIRSIACDPLDTSPYYKQYLKDSGGVFLDTVIHDIDLSLFLFGEDSLPKSVTGVGLTVSHPQLAADGDSDNAVGICEFWDGKIAFFYNNRISAHGYDNATEIFGTAGKISVNLRSKLNAIEVCDADGMIKTPGQPTWYDRYKEAFVHEAVAWVDAVLDGKPMPVPLQSSLVSLKIATALQESLRTGQKIFFDRDGSLKSKL